MNDHKFFSLSKPLLAILLASNIVFAWWLEKKIGSYWGWMVVDLSTDLNIDLTTALAVLQFVIFGLSIDMSIRTTVTSINHKLKGFQIPEIAVTAMTTSTYGIVGLIGFILLYDHSLSHILAAAGAVGIGAAYIFREWISDVTASIQIQTDHLASINDYIQVNEEKDVYRVTQIDHRMVTIEDKFAYLIRIPTRQFLNWKYINLSKQPTKRGVKRRCTFNLTSQNDSNRVLSMMNNGMQYLISKDERFYQGYSCQIQEITGGAISYGISYECDPSLSFLSSSNSVYGALLHIFNAAAINLNSDIEIYRPSIGKSDAKQRLLDIYQSSILKVLDENQIQELASVVHLVPFESGDQIIKHGELAQSMYFISEGHLEVGIPGNDGIDLIVATLWPGDCVGEMSLLTGEPRSANVYAKTNGILLEVTKGNLAPFLTASPILIEKISQVLADRKAKNEKAASSEDEIKSQFSQIKALAQKIFHFFFETK